MIIKFIKKNFIACLALFLALSVFVTGSISFARYATSVDINDGAGAGSFSATATIDGVSALSFTNTAFWGGTVGDDKIAMNALRSINFSVYNYDHKDDEINPTEVKLSYTLTFSAPANFIEKLAFQLFDGSNHPVLPQIVILDLMHAISEGNSTGTYRTQDSEDYNGTPIDDLTFSVTKQTSGTYTARSGQTIVSVTPFKKSVQQTINCRVWDTSSLDGDRNTPLEIEGGTLLSPLSIKYTDVVDCYKISISSPLFKMTAGTATVNNYSIKITPTSVLEDNHLGGSFYDGDDLVTEIYGGDGSVWTIKSIHEEYEDHHYGVDNIAGTADDSIVSHGQNIMSHKIYRPGSTESVETNHLHVETVTNEEEIGPDTSAYSYTTQNDTSTVAISNRDDFFAKYPERTQVQNLTYRAPVTKEITRTYTITEKKVYTTTTTTTETDVIDSVTTDTVSADGLTITQTITERTIVNESSHTTTTVETTTTTVTETRSISGTRTCSFNNWNSGYTLKTSTVAWNGGNGDANQFNASSTIVTPESSVTSTEVGEPQSSSTPATKKSDQTETINRLITRSFREDSIIIDEVSRKVGENIILYTKDNVLSMFNDANKQIYFISQSYSKNYPLSVDVLFEQILE